jgi:hypothetical protein
LSLAAAFCRSRPLVRPFAADGSKVHELEHDAGGVKTVVIAKVEIVFVEVLYGVVAVAAVSLMFASTSKVKDHHQKESNGLARGKRGSLCTESQLAAPAPLLLSAYFVISQIHLPRVSEARLTATNLAQI